MAGMGKRMRPHTLNTPKPLLKIAGKSLVQRIVEDLKASTNNVFDEIHYVIGEFGKDIENELLNIALNIGAKGYIHFQNEPLGTAHAIYCADIALNGEVIIAFADTLFEGDFSITKNDEAIIWTMCVSHPESYGVVITNKNYEITGFAEKPKSFISNEAIIGIYYFKNAQILKEKIEILFKNKTVVKGEYQLTDALELLMKDSITIRSANIDKWLDCGNKNEFLVSAKNVLEREFKNTVYNYKNTKIKYPVYIGKNVSIVNSVIGPYVIVEDDTIICDSKIRDTIIYNNCKIDNSETTNSIIGNNSIINCAKGVLNVGDYSTYESI